MHLARRRTVASLAAATLLASSLACQASTAPAASMGPSQGTGVARVLVAALTTTAVARITVTVAPGDGPNFVPFSVDLTQTGSQWTGRITGIPAGPGRLFDAKAYDAGGTKLLEGSGKSDIVVGGAAVVSIVLQEEQPGLANAFPIIDSIAASRDAVGANATVQFIASAHDPDPGDGVQYGWIASCGVLDTTSRPNPVWTAPAALGSCTVSLTVSDTHGASTTASLVIAVVPTGDASVVVTFNGWPVIAGVTGSVTLGAQLDGVVAVVAADPDGDPLTYAWTSTCPAIAFDSGPPYGGSIAHLVVPGPSPTCNVVATVSDGRGGNTTATLTLPPNQSLTPKCAGVTCQLGQTCDPAVGQCKPTDLCATVTCPPASDACHVAGTCNVVTGVCDSQTAKTCPSGQACDPSTGSCAATNLCAAVTCPPPSDPCHVGGTCDASTGTCSAQVSKTCPSGQSCDVSTGQCQGASTAAVPVPQVARDVPVSPPAGLAMDASGNSYLAAAINSVTPIGFDGHNVASTGDFDAFFARYDTAGHAAWAVGYGDALANAQIATGAAVTNDGTLAVIGSFSGSFTIGTTITSASPIDFLAALRTADGSGVWAKQLNDGPNGILKAVAANPGDASSTHGNRIAVCGIASQAATDLVPGATYGGLNDVVIAVYTSTGTRLWSKQIGTAANEECNAVAVDDDGDVYAAGKFDGATLTIPGTPTLTGPGSSIRKFVWIAKLDGATGNGVASVAFGNATGQSNPTSLAVDPAGKLLVGGSFTPALPLGSTTLSTAGGTDGFVAKLDPTAGLAPIWAVRLGGTGADAVNGVATTSTGDVLVTGLFNKTTTGVAALTAGSTTAADAFLLKLDGATGAAQFSAAYGDPVTQSGDAVAVNRFGGNQFAMTGTLNGSISFPAPAAAITAVGAQDVFVLVGLVQ